jgi:small subunit ribosomal protein S4
MARDLNPIVKRSRREGYALHPKAHKALVKRSTIPGQHGRSMRRVKASQYSLQLREKQKVKRLYGVLEKPFAKLLSEATKASGQSGERLLEFLERRADNAVYRAGLAPSRRAARQLVTHGHLMHNGRRIDVPSLRVADGDVLKVKDSSRNSAYFKHLDDLSPAPPEIPAWLKVNRGKLEIMISGTPTREDAEADIKEQLIVEYYSR